MMSISRGIGMPRMPAGTTLDEWLLVWTGGELSSSGSSECSFSGEEGTPIARAVDLAYNDSVLFLSRSKVFIRYVTAC